MVHWVERSMVVMKKKLYLIDPNSHFTPFIFGILGLIFNLIQPESWNVKTVVP